MDLDVLGRVYHALRFQKLEDVVRVGCEDIYHVRVLSARKGFLVVAGANLLVFESELK